MNRYEELVRGALDETVVHSSTTYSWFRRRGPQLGREAEEAMTPEAARAFLVYSLQMQLYADFYCRGAATPAAEEPGASWPMATGPSPLLLALSAANSGRGSFEPNWTIRRFEDARVVVERDGLNLWAKPEEVAAQGGGELAPGSAVMVKMPKELLKLSPGFYMALGDQALPSEGSEALVRFYWNLRSEGARRLVGALTDACNRVGLAFRLKVVNDPLRFSRCDAGVLYVRQAEYEAVAPIVARTCHELRGFLKPVTPVFTKYLASGVGLAEEPGGGNSFGTHRCYLLADGIVRAHERGLVGLEDRLRAVAERFEEVGISLEKPYLNAGSDAEYAFPGGRG